MRERIPCGNSNDHLPIVEWLKTNGIACDKETAELFEQSVNKYLDLVAQTRLVSSLLVGSNPQTGEGYVWAILSKPLNIKESGWEEFEVLDNAGGDLHRDLLSIMQIRVSTAGPNQLANLQRTCQSRGIDVSLIEIA